MSSTKPTILIQLDTDPMPSVFDSVVAVDSQVDHLFRQGGVTPDNVRELVHGALFTRGGPDLARTAIFIGGSNVEAGEAVLEAVKKTFFMDFRVSVLLDSNGANTTAAAAVLSAMKSLGGSLEGVKAGVLAGTGPVGLRVAKLLATVGASSVAVGSRQLDKAKSAAGKLSEGSKTSFRPFSYETAEEALAEAAVIIAAGASGVTLLPASLRSKLKSLKVAVDLNAVPPLGIEGVKSNDKGNDRDGLLCWGALGVGSTKMKIHKKAIEELFTSNDKILDAEEVIKIGRSL